MKKFLAVLFASTCIHAIHFNNCFVTYKLSNDRLGDKITIYSIAKLISYMYRIPLLYKPFPYSSLLMLDKLERRYSLSLEKHKKKIVVNKLSDIKKKDYANTLFESHMWTDTGINMYQYAVTHPDFGNILKKMLSPRHAVTPYQLPKEKITIAVHIRIGSMGDPKNNFTEFFDETAHSSIINKQNIWHPRFLPLQYYVNQINNLSVLLGNRPLFVKIFTDSNDPRVILKSIKSHIKLSNIQFETHYPEIIHNNRIIDDLYWMAQFDCLICSSSGFATAVKYLGNHKIIISPITAYRKNSICVVDLISIDLRNNDKLATTILKSGNLIQIQALCKQAQTLFVNKIST